MRTFNVYLDNVWIDRVFYGNDCDKDYVLNGLINHDNYDPNITIKEVL